jgi:hypothetical protein
LSYLDYFHGWRQIDDPIYNRKAIGAFSGP